MRQVFNEFTPINFVFVLLFIFLFLFLLRPHRCFLHLHLRQVTRKTVFCFFFFILLRSLYSASHQRSIKKQLKWGPKYFSYLNSYHSRPDSFSYPFQEVSSFGHRSDKRLILIAPIYHFLSFSSPFFCFFWLTQAMHPEDSRWSAWRSRRLLKPAFIFNLNWTYFMT